MITPDELRKCAMCVYLATEEKVADDISKYLREAADTIEQQTELLRRAKEVVGIGVITSKKVTQRFNNNKESLSASLLVFSIKTQVLLPELEKALEVGK